MFESDKYKLGVFVLSSLLLICLIFIAVGLFDFGTPKVHMMTLFSESVQGLENGSFVKYRGVPIGKVKDITISTSGTLIRVDMEIYLTKMRNEAVGGITPKTITAQQFYQSLDYQIQKGLRARIELSGITGGKYIDFDYHESPGVQGKCFAVPGLNKDGVFYIPSEPSMMSGIRTNAMEILAKIASIDYKAIADRMEKVLGSADIFLNDPNLKNTIANTREVSDELKKTIHALNNSFDRKRLDQIGTQTLETMNAMQKLSKELEMTVRKAQIPETAASFRNASGTVSDTVESMEETIVKLNEVTDALSELVQTLDNNPASVINGKKRPFTYKKENQR